MDTPKINIAIIDDHQLFVQSLSNLLKKMDCIGNIVSYTSPGEYVNDESEAEPEVILCDIIMPEINGMDILALHKKKTKKGKVIILSTVTEIQTVRHAMRSGASGFLSKDTSVEELADAIITVYHGQPYIGESLRKGLIRNSFAEDHFVFNLSPREKEVLKQVCSGKTIKEAAYDMNLSANTVQTYYKAIQKKFNIHRTPELIVFAIKNGLYNPQDK